MTNETQSPSSGTPIHHHHHHCGSGFGKILVGLLVILIGLFYLAKNVGWLPAGFELDWNMIWPLLIIIAGLSLISGRGWFSGLVGFLVAIVLVGAIALLIFMSLPGMDGVLRTFWRPNFDGAREPDRSDLKETEIEIERVAGAKAAEISLKGGAGKFVLKGGGAALAQGKFRSNLAELETSSKTDGEIQSVAIETVGRRPRLLGPFENSLELTLTHEIPLDLLIETGAADLEFDLTRLVLKNLDIKTGASSLKLALGDKAANSSVNIKAGASAVELELPKTAGARIRLESSLTSLEIEGFEKIDERNFETPNYREAPKKIDLNLSLGISSLVVKLR